MTEAAPTGSRILYLLVCAAPPAQQTLHVVAPLQKAGWDVCVIATPQAGQWIDRSALESLTGHVVRTEYKLPGEVDPLPKADAILVMPATFNTINKWAQGIGDTLVTSILCEALGRGATSVLAVPCLKMDLVRHPAFKKSIALLRECGVRVLHEPEHYPSPLMVPWNQVFETFSEMTENKKEP
jgi:phosphopantothenoylcysteine synthetase/decarboxylase